MVKWLLIYWFLDGAEHLAEMLRFQAKDGEIVSVERVAAERSILVKNLIEDLGDVADEVIPVPEVSAVAVCLFKLLFC